MINKLLSKDRAVEDHVCQIEYLQRVIIVDREHAKQIQQAIDWHKKQIGELLTKNN